MDDTIQGYTLKERNGIGHAISSTKAEKWARSHIILSKILIKTKLFKRVMKPKVDQFTMMEGDTLTISKNRDYTQGCGRNARILWSEKQPEIYLRFTNGHFTYPRTSEINDSNFRDLRHFCNECGQEVCDGHE